MTDDEFNEHMIAMLDAVVARLKELRRDAAGSKDEILRFHMETSLRAAQHALTRLRPRSKAR